MAVPSPYGRDPFAQLNRLIDAHQTAPGSIRRVCLAVEECLANNRDNLRGFFDKPFANLLKRVFGYGDFEASWLNIVTKGRDADARALVNLLAPDGKLFAAMAQADSDRLVQYIFPIERLPAHTQELLKEPQGLGRQVLDSWPQYRGRIRHDAAGRPQVYLNLFEYFMFWTAFYVLRGSSSDGTRSDPRATPGSSGSSMMGMGMGGIRSVGSAIVGNLMMGRSTGTLQGHPYYQLLKTYLEYFLPRSVGSSGLGGGAADASRTGPAGAGAGAAAAPGVPGMGGLGFGLGLGDPTGAGTAGWASYKPSLTAAAAGPESRGAVLLSILVEFWLTDPVEPLPSLTADRVSGVVHPGSGVGPMAGLGLGGGAVGTAAGGFGGMAGSPGGVAGMAGSASPTPVAVSMPPSVRMLTYQPPSAELVEGLVALVRYVHVVERESRAADGANGAGGASAAGSRTPGPGGIAPGPMGRASPIHSASRGGAHGGGGGTPGGAAPAPLQPAQVGCPPWLPETPVKTPPPPPPRLLVPPTVLLVQGNSASAAVQAVSRKVYRQLRRAIALWPPSSPSSLTPLISLWLSILAPWCPPYAHTRKTAAAEAPPGGAAGAPGHGAAANGAGGPSGAAGSNGAAQPLHNHHHHVLDGAGVLGSAAAAAAAGVMEATAAKLQFSAGHHREKDRDVAGATSRELLSQFKYSPAWRSHVLAHLPFYLVLLPQFVTLSMSRLKYRPDAALRDLDRVLAVLAAAGPELLRELRTAEAVYNDFARPPAAGGRRRSEGEFGEMAPWWLEQAQDFEAAAAAGSSPPAAVQPDIMGRLFTTDTAGATYTTCLLLRNAETLGRPELVAALRQSAGAVLPLDSILPAAVADQSRAGEGAEGQLGGADGRRFPRAGRWSALIQDNPKLADPHQLWTYLYRGRDNRHDPLLRPIASNEVAWLVRPLVRASVRANAALGLDVPYRPGEEEADPPEHLGQQALLWARKKGYRINLRFLAEVQTLLWLLGLALLAYLMACAFSGGGGSAGASGAAAPTPAKPPVPRDGAVNGYSPGSGRAPGSHSGGSGASTQDVYGHQQYGANHHNYHHQYAQQYASYEASYDTYYTTGDDGTEPMGPVDMGLEDAPLPTDSAGYRFRS